MLIHIKPKTLCHWDHHSIILYCLGTRSVGNDTGTLYGVGTLCIKKWKHKRAYHDLRISVGNTFHAVRCSHDKSTLGHFVVCMLCFTLTTIASAYEDWAYISG